MTFTLRNSMGIDTVFVPPDDQTAIAPITATTRIFDESGTVDLLGAVNVAGYAYFTVPGFDWQGHATAGVDTLIGDASNELIYWDRATGAQLEVKSPEIRFRLDTSTDNHVEVYDMGGGHDIVNLTFMSLGVDVPFASSVTVYGGTGNDIVAFGTGADRAFGDDGNDLLFGGGGGDQLSGNGGVDSLYGGSGEDSLLGGGGNDTLYGGSGHDDLSGDGGADMLFGEAGNDTVAAGASNVGQDSLFGGDGDDTLIYSNDGAIIAPDAHVVLWDGETGSNVGIIFSNQGKNLSDAHYDGGAGIDTILLSESGDILTADTADIVIGGTPFPGGANRLTQVEIILAGAGADIVAINDANAFTPGNGIPYMTAITIAGESGADVLAGGTGIDLIVGGNLTLGAAGTDADLLFGGAGGDNLWGDDLGDPFGQIGGDDTLYGGGGADTIYGGGGNDILIDDVFTAEIDSLFGGAGDDQIFDPDSANAFGGAGSDLIIINQNKEIGFNFSGGGDTPTDGADRVIITGTYTSVIGSLGAGDDSYIAKADGVGARSDSVDGQSGDDVISTWAGADTLIGGDGTDVLWGGAGSDLLSGGAGTDFLYAQEDNDTIYGGADWDMIYYGRNDGHDQYYDVNREGGVAARENWLVVYGVFDQSEIGPMADFLLDGAGVGEVDFDLTDGLGAGDEAWVHQNTLTADPNDWVLEVRNTEGGVSSITFDQRDVAGIGLWDNDHAVNPFQTIQVYLWNGSTYAYAYST